MCFFLPWRIVCPITLSFDIGLFFPGVCGFCSYRPFLTRSFVRSSFFFFVPSFLRLRLPSPPPAPCRRRTKSPSLCALSSGPSLDRSETQEDLFVVLSMIYDMVLFCLVFFCPLEHYLMLSTNMVPPEMCYEPSYSSERVTWYFFPPLLYFYIFMLQSIFMHAAVAALM